MKSSRGKILRYTIDRYTVAFVLFFFTVQLTIWRFAPPWLAACLAVPLYFASMMSASIHHNHQHVNVFRKPWLNRFFEVPLTLQTGVGPYTWVLHHNLGHHLNYLEQRDHEAGVDESRWLRKDGSKMGRLEYSVFLFVKHPFDVYRVGKKHPRIYRNYLLMRIPLYTLLALLFTLNPLNTAILFVALPLTTLFHTCSATYEHHSGLETKDHLLASRNNTSPFYNLLSQNLGYHTAHHMRPGLHWSELPAFHEQIRTGIPDAHIKPTFW
jgi:beta-carotene hydroxylase